MNGYWRGTFSGDSSGEISLEIDKRRDAYRGFAYLYSDNSPLNFMAPLTLPLNSNTLDFSGPVLPLDPNTGEATEWAEMERRDPSISGNHSNSFCAHCEWRGSNLSLRWTTDRGHQGAAELTRDSRTKSCVEVIPISTWNEYKEYVSSLPQFDYAFRGQAGTWKLRTPFHRTGSGDMLNFFREINTTVSRHVSAFSRHVFDLENRYQFAAFLNLIQHHGFPTPLLDWTYSPYVAAYFAFNEITKSQAAAAEDNEMIRIFIFNKSQWCSNLTQILSVANRRPHFSILDPIAIGNQRLVPQQALSSFTSVDDIENYIISKETADTKYLQAVDLPKKVRPVVMRELSMMGVTAGSLFPGLDGICRELKERLFDL